MIDLHHDGTLNDHSWARQAREYLMEHEDADLDEPARFIHNGRVHMTARRIGSMADVVVTGVSSFGRWKPVEGNLPQEQLRERLDGWLRRTGEATDGEVDLAEG